MADTDGKKGDTIGKSRRSNEVYEGSDRAIKRRREINGYDRQVEHN